MPFCRASQTKPAMPPAARKAPRRIARTQGSRLFSSPPEHHPRPMPAQPNAASISRLARARSGPRGSIGRGCARPARADQTLAAVSRGQAQGCWPSACPRLRRRQGDGQRRQAEKHAATGRWNQALRQVMQALAAPAASQRQPPPAQQQSRRPPASAVSAVGQQAGAVQPGEYVVILRVMGEQPPGDVGVQRPGMSCSISHSAAPCWGRQTTG